MAVSQRVDRPRILVGQRETDYHVMPSGESPLKLAYVILSMRSLKDSILKFHMQLLLAGKRAALKLSNVIGN